MSDYIVRVAREVVSEYVCEADTPQAALDQVRDGLLVPIVDEVLDVLDVEVEDNHTGDVFADAALTWYGRF